MSVFIVLYKIVKLPTQRMPYPPPTGSHSYTLIVWNYIHFLIISYFLSEFPELVIKTHAKALFALHYN